MKREGCDYCDNCGQRLGMYGHLHDCKTADQAVIQSRLMQAEEAKRAENAKNHVGPCVPWRGRDGKLGACIYCGKMDAISAYYIDRANGCHAAKAP
jgi:hypothetical protein